MKKKEVTVTFRVDAEYKRFLESIANHYEVSLSEFVRGIIVDVIEDIDLPFDYVSGDE